MTRRQVAAFSGWLAGLCRADWSEAKSAPSLGKMAGDRFASYPLYALISLVAQRKTRHERHDE